MKSGVIRCLWLLTLATVAETASAQHSLYFGGSGVVEVQEPRLPTGSEPMTVEFWFKMRTSLKKPVHLVSRWHPDAKAEDRGSFHVGFSSSNRLVFGVRDEEGGEESVAGRLPRDDGAWHHVAAVFDGASLALYFDGQNVGVEELPEFAGRASTELPLSIGPVAVKPARQAPVFDGFLGGVGIWAEARDEAAIREEMDGALTGDDRGLRAYFTLREESPTSVILDRTRDHEGRLSERLARSGWCHTASWDDPADLPSMDLHCHDLVGAQGASELEGCSRKILVRHDKEQRIGVLWQHGSSRSIHVTWVDVAAGQHHTRRLPNELKAADAKKGEEAPGLTNGFLAAGTSDPEGNLYYLVIQESPRSRDEDVPLLGTLFKASPDGELVAENAIDCSRSAFNVWSFGQRGHANMRFSKGKLGLILPRTMYISGDGLRHQAAIAVVFSAKNLEIARMLGTTSSHSKGNILTVNSRGEFLGLDLGDNYPRGVHLHKFTAASKFSRVVFTYKTAHGTRPRNGSPIYEEISGDGKTFYKWSNDNAVYTELGGVVDGRRHQSVIFSTDQSLEGKVLDNSRAFRNSGDPRNIAMLRVIKNFQKAPRGSVVSDVIMAGLPKGNQVEESGFFTFAGGWSRQRVTGVIWLTQYGPNEAAHAPQTALLEDDSILVLWEKSGADGDSLQAMRVEQSGEVLEGPMQLDLRVKLNRQDGLMRLEDRIFLLATTGRDDRTCLYSIHDDS